MVAWLENDDLFRRLVSEGYAWQAIPYAFLALHGFDVEMPPLSIREDVSKRENWHDTYDLRIGSKTVEVKSRSFRFTSPGDWPKNRLPAFVDTVRKWDSRERKPFAYIFMSKKTGSMVATRADESACGRWSKVEAWDRVRKIHETFYSVGVKHLVTMDVLVDALRQC